MKPALAAPEPPAPGAPWVRADLQPLFAGLDFEAFLALGTERVRTGPDGARHTSRFERGGRRFYLKVHTGVGWREILRCWLQGKCAIVDARPEALALTRLAELGLAAPRLAAWGVRGRDPARRVSFLVTESLEESEDLAEALARTPHPPVRFRQALAREVGRIAGRLHAARLAHQDLYLTHFRLRRHADGSFALFLLDLHRAYVASSGRRRWQRKDLAALRYSTLALPVTRADCARFFAAYRAELASTGRAAERALRRRVEARAHRVRARIARRGGAD